ncbi:hypothetical protein [Pseudomonas sp. CFBP 13719]|nr:hypothetical protein [Pseudomonas sp. CFBP 13719]MBD8615598.1 hypothetical protein [Pseudomonas putida]MBD8681750.1 hypothetical protein [Pseudomonas sp. CFBP 13719]
MIAKPLKGLLSSVSQRRWLHTELWVVPMSIPVAIIAGQPWYGIAVMLLLLLLQMGLLGLWLARAFPKHIRPKLWHHVVSPYCLLLELFMSVPFLWEMQMKQDEIARIEEEMAALDTQES